MKYWGIVPAAGSGTRMNKTCPKQYLKLHGRYVLDYCLSALLDHPALQKVIVSLDSDTSYWKASAYHDDARVQICAGGACRMHSVLNALQVLAPDAADDDWVLVHDAVRPCLGPSEIERLVDVLQDDAVGGILALPVVDTIKQSDAAGNISKTLDRRALYRAVTPQMFRYQLLYTALKARVDNADETTDEAQAMELAGHKVRLVEAQGVNIKITGPDDLVLAECYLSNKLEAQSSSEHSVTK